MSEEMTLWDYLRVFRRRYRVIIILPLLALLAAMLYSRSLPERFVTKSLLEIQKNLIREGAGLQRVSISPFERATLTRLAGNKDVAYLAAEILTGGRGTEVERERISREVRSMVTVGNLDNSNFIEVSASGPDPGRIAEVCNAYAQAVIRYHDEQRRVSVQDLKNYLQTQIDRYGQRVRETDDQLRQLRTRDGAMMNAGGQTPETLRRIDDRLLVLGQEDKMLTDRVAALDKAVAAGDVEAFLVAVPGSNLERDYQTLLARRAELADLMNRYTEGFPAVSKLKDVVSELEAGLARRMPAAAAVARTAVLQQRDGKRGERERLQAEHGMIQSAIASLPDRMQQEDSLQRELAIATSVSQMFRQRLEDLELSLTTPSDRLEVSEPALAPAKPIYPNRSMILSMGFTVGLVLSLALAFLLESLDTSLSEISEVERFINKPILAVIPAIRVDAAKVAECKIAIRKELLEHLPFLVDPRSPSAEAYRTLRAVLTSRFFSTGGKTLLVTSTTPQEGKTTTIVNLAMACAAAGMKTVLVGANMRHPVIGRHFQIDRTRGLNEILQGHMTVDECVQATGYENLSILDSGGFARRPAELLAGHAFDDALTILKSRFDVVLVDSPPTLPVADAATMAPKVDGILLVYLVSVAPRDALLRCKEMLEEVGGNVVGVVFNDIWGASQMDYAGYYYHQKYAGDELKRL